MILKPMNVGEILDNTVKIFRAEFKAYLAIAGLGIAAPIGLGLFVLIFYLLLGEIGAGIAALIVFIPYVVFNLAIIGGLIKKASEQIEGREISIKEAYFFGLQKVGRLFFSSLLYGLALVMGFILLVIPGIYLSVAFASLCRRALLMMGGLGALCPEVEV